MPARHDLNGLNSFHFPSNRTKPSATEFGLHPVFQTSLEEAFMEPVNGSASVPTLLKADSRPWRHAKMLTPT